MRRHGLVARRRVLLVEQAIVIGRYQARKRRGEIRARHAVHFHAGNVTDSIVRASVEMIYPEINL
jgi:hypothetical protein